MTDLYWGLLVVLIAVTVAGLGRWCCQWLRTECAQCQLSDWVKPLRAAFWWLGVWFVASSAVLMAVELSTAERLVWLGWLALLGLLGLIDAQTGLLPNELTLVLLLSGLLWRATDPLLASWHVPEQPYLWGVLLGWGLPFGVNALHERWRACSAIGQGDAKLLAGVGAWLGVQALPLTWLVASLSVLVYTAGWWAVTRHWQSRVTFGPFLVMGASIAMLMSHV